MRVSLFTVTCVLLSLAGSRFGIAASLQPPIAFASEQGELNIIITATSAPISFDAVSTNGWVYEVCKRASRFDTTCLPNRLARLSGQSFYGGVVLRLSPNDTLNIRLVNSLPAVPDAKHCVENPVLANNPTNLHTHGLIVEPYRSAGGSDPYGDYVFVEVHNPANNVPCAEPATGSDHAASALGGSALKHMHESMPHGHSMGAYGVAGGTHPDMDVAYGAVEYSIRLTNHPSGLFWFHPHMHGVALNQVSAGLAGAITVGNVADECLGDPACLKSAASERLMILKDTQVLANGTLLNQQDPTFCNGLPPDPGARVVGRVLQLGKCAGIANYLNGYWFHTINGQVYPQIDVGSDGEIWRIVNAAASRSYDLFIQDDADGSLVPMQLISVDGIAVDGNGSGQLAALQAQVGGKAEVFACPASTGQGGSSACTYHIKMMPSSRMSVRVINDQANYRTGVFQTAEYLTGPSGDDWPQINLAAVTLAPATSNGSKSSRTTSSVRAALSAIGVLGATPKVSVPNVPGLNSLTSVQRSMRNFTATPTPSPSLSQTRDFAIDPALKFGLRADPNCQNLAPGERRRVYFGSPTPNLGFALATSIIGADGAERVETTTPMQSFDPSQTTVCITASATDGQPTTETWELVNLTGEDHNFHIHQTRFFVIDAGTTAKTASSPMVLQDNIPVYHASNATNCDGTIASFRSGLCQPYIYTVSIPFTQIGDFVFHCHILEHEDGGMMARIRIVAPYIGGSQSKR